MPNAPNSSALGSGTLATRKPRRALQPAGLRLYSDVYADPGAFDTRAYHHAQTDGTENNYTYGSSQTWNWFVLSGGKSGSTLSLAADILIQGEAFADNGIGGNAGTIFGTSLGFLASPQDLVQDYSISVTGAVNWDAGFATNNTIDANLSWNEGPAAHEINLIVRSQPFTVTVGVPFRLSLLTSVQGFAGPGNWGESRSDFFDPRLVTSADFANIPDLTPEGFAVWSDQGYSTLGEAGYSIMRVPESGTLAAMGCGLCCVAVLRRSRIG